MNIYLVAKLFTVFVFVFLLFIVAVVLHDIGYAFVAYLLGDNGIRKRERFRISDHFCFGGSFLIPVITFLMYFPYAIIGYTKPIFIDMKKFKKPILYFILVGLAGPMVNLLLAIGSFFLIKVLAPHMDLLASGLVVFSCINFSLFCFNLMPIPPLDGGRVLFGLLYRNSGDRYEKLESKGIFIIFILELLSIVLLSIFNFNCDFFYLITRGFLAFSLNF